MPLHYVSKLARDNGTIVVQVGEGSDELFHGYQGYIDARALPRALLAAVPARARDRCAARQPGVERVRRRTGHGLVRTRRRRATRRPGGSPFWGGAIA